MTSSCTPRRTRPACSDAASGRESAAAALVGGAPAGTNAAEAAPGGGPAPLTPCPGSHCRSCGFKWKGSEDEKTVSGCLSAYFRV